MKNEELRKSLCSAVLIIIVLKMIVRSRGSRRVAFLNSSFVQSPLSRLAVIIKRFEISIELYSEISTILGV